MTTRTTRKVGLRSKLAAAGIAASVLVGASAAGLASSPPASAALTMCGSHGCNLYQYGPGNGFFFITPGFWPVHMVCWTTGPFTDGTGKWFKITDTFGTGTNWTPANDVIFQTTVGHC